ncbi:arginyltransferase [Humisphaera borealis]|uniref:Aspartate/glutamate leucyltransferase n=1 Tax=Humisphaera borealis TaxID=2807512 RepID=A0A7M2WQN3_9BACT|nr:arginyltransferase [Humisphaera borealis]QOV87719.1 arginyltransferase [Humisphaera borealis]
MSSNRATHPPDHPATFSCYPAIPPPIRLSLVNTGEHACPYLPGRMSSNRAFWAEQIPPEVYHAFMDAGFRRSGKFVYQPVCRGCRQCISIRVPVKEFRASKSQRRCLRRNDDLRVAIGPPEPDAERFALYQKYVTQWHGKKPADDPEDPYESFCSFLYESPVDTVEYQYRDQGGRLIGVGICDLSPQSLSSVYFYHDPDESHRSLGTFSALREIGDCIDRGIPYYYLGYWVDQCTTMDYKSSYKPHQILHPDGIWRNRGAD